MISRLVLKFIKAALEDKNQRKIQRKNDNMTKILISNFLLELHLEDVLEVLLVVEGEFLFYKLVYTRKYQRNILWKNYDDWFINNGDIKLFNLSKKKRYRSLSYRPFHKILSYLIYHFIQCICKLNFGKILWNWLYI